MADRSTVNVWRDLPFIRKLDCENRGGSAGGVGTSEALTPRKHLETRRAETRMVSDSPRPRATRRSAAGASRESSSSETPPHRRAEWASLVAASESAASLPGEPDSKLCAPLRSAQSVVQSRDEGFSSSRLCAGRETAPLFTRTIEAGLAWSARSCYCRARRRYDVLSARAHLLCSDSFLLVLLRHPRDGALADPTKRAPLCQRSICTTYRTRCRCSCAPESPCCSLHPGPLLFHAWSRIARHVLAMSSCSRLPDKVFAWWTLSGSLGSPASGSRLCACRAHPREGRAGLTL